MKEQGEFKIHNGEGYTVVNNIPLYDSTLGLKARGMFTTLLCLPKGWRFSIAGLAAILPEGETAIKTALKELERHRLFYRAKVKGKDGRFEYKYHVFVVPTEFKTDDDYLYNDKKTSLVSENKTILPQGGFLGLDDHRVEINDNKISKLNKYYNDKDKDVDISNASLKIINKLVKSKLLLEDEDELAYASIIQEFLDHMNDKGYVFKPKNYADLIIKCEYVLKFMKDKNIEDRLSYFNQALKNNFLDGNLLNLIPDDNYNTK